MVGPVVRAWSLQIGVPQLQALQTSSTPPPCQPSPPPPPLKSLTGDTEQCDPAGDRRTGSETRSRGQNGEAEATEAEVGRHQGRGLGLPVPPLASAALGEGGLGGGGAQRPSSGWDGGPPHHLELFRPICPTPWAQGGGERTMPDSRLCAPQHCAGSCRGS